MSSWEHIRGWLELFSFDALMGVGQAVPTNEEAEEVRIQLVFSHTAVGDNGWNQLSDHVPLSTSQTIVPEHKIIRCRCILHKLWCFTTKMCDRLWTRSPPLARASAGLLLVSFLSLQVTGKCCKYSLIFFPFVSGYVNYKGIMDTSCLGNGSPPSPMPRFPTGLRGVFIGAH